MFRDQIAEDRIRNSNRLHREMEICFPEGITLADMLEWQNELVIDQYVI